jgi:hypothetical protein
MIANGEDREQDCGMDDGAKKGARRTWLYLVVGAVVGAALGVLVGATTDVPLAPEAGLALGLLAGWLVSRART